MAEREQQIVFITGNQNKAAEIERYAAIPIAYQPLDILEIQPPSLALEEVVIHKAREAHRMLNPDLNKPRRSALVEDTSLTLHSWGKLPGPYIKWYMEEPPGNEGLVRMLLGYDDRSATATTAFGLCEDGKEVVIFEGSTEGTIATQPRGEIGFGWDAIFIPNSGDGRTWGEMTPDEKQADSMRAKALLQFERSMQE